MQISYRLGAKLHCSVVLPLCNVPSLLTTLALTHHYPSMYTFLEFAQWNRRLGTLQNYTTNMYKGSGCWAWFNFLKLWNWIPYLSPFNCQQLCRSCRNNVAQSLTNAPSKDLHLTHLELSEMLVKSVIAHMWILPLNFYRHLDHCNFNHQLMCLYSHPEHLLLPNICGRVEAFFWGTR